MVQTPTSNFQNGDMIRVPRDLLGAALHCVRKHAGSDSETYKQLSALAFLPAEPTYAGIPISELARGTYHPGDDA